MTPTQLLSSMIATRGPVSVATYMRACQQNYYRPSVFGGGPDSDFVTSPDISNCFGEMVAVWLMSVWAMGRPDRSPDAAGAGPCRLVELGAGRGTLVADVLRTCRRVSAAGGDAALPVGDVHFVENAPALRDVQRAAVHSQWPGLPVVHHERLQDVPRDRPLLVLAHEFFDCMPIHVLRRDHRDAPWREQLVDVATPAAAAPLPAGHQTDPRSWGRAPFRFVQSDTLTSQMHSAAAPASPFTVAEISPDALSALDELTDALHESPFGAALLVDYGYDEWRADQGPSLRAIHRHRILDDPLEAPVGQADVSALVDFGALRRAALARSHRQPTTVAGPVSQSQFLRALGMEVRIARLKSAQERQAAQRLIDPHRTHGLGETYRVMSVINPGQPAAAADAASSTAARSPLSQADSVPGFWKSKAAMG